MTQTLNVLVDARKRCRICVDRYPGEICNGSQEIFDPPVVSYWSQWLGNQAPKVLIVGQDFSDIGYFQRNKGFDDPNNDTNKNLKILLNYARIRVGTPPVQDTIAPVFLTNSVLCLKNGAMNAPLRSSWVKSCSIHHLRPLISHLQPPAIIALGKHGWDATRAASELISAPPLIRHAAGCHWVTRDNRIVFAVAHCSGLGLANRLWNIQVADWIRIGATLTKLGIYTLAI